MSDKAAMTNLLKEPQSPGIAFLKGAGAAAAAMLGPFVAMLFSNTPTAHLWKDIGLLALIMSVAAGLAGAAFAGWALLQRWAYDKVRTKEDAW
jgi:hypothetical protein